MRKFTKITESNGRKMKLGLDFHGVVDSMPDFFSFLTESFIRNGGEVHIITGGHISDNFVKKLESLNIKYTHIFSVYDHLVSNNDNVIGEIVFPDGGVQKKFENTVWDNVKAEYCLKNGIDLHLDDTLIYNDFFKTPFARLWSHSNNPKEGHKDVRHMD